MSKEEVNRLGSLIVVLGIFAGFLATLIITARHGDLVIAQSPKPKPTNQQDERPNAGNDYLFSQETPSGDWLAQAEFDISQANDPNIPVVIAAIRSYVGKGNWRKHLMIESVVLKNRSTKVIKAFRLGWIIITEEDRKAGKNQEAALLQGFTELIDADMAARGGRTKRFNLEFLKAAKQLIRNGSLTGTFFLRIRLTEIHFEDGSVWMEHQAVASRRKYSHRRCG